MISQQELRANLQNCLMDARYERWDSYYKKGKVRDMYLLPDKRVLITTDRQSAFDHVLGTIPLKGQVLNRIAQFWFERTADIVPNQVIAVPDGNVTVAEELDMLPRRDCRQGLPDREHGHVRVDTLCQRGPGLLRRAAG